MGVACSWVAVRGKEDDAVLGSLGLRRSGQREEIPKSRWCAAILPDGWLLVFRSDHCEPAEFGEAALRALSARCEVLHASVEEHVMVSTAALWRDGSRVWEIVHDAQKSPDDLQALGDLPPVFGPIRDRAALESRDDEEVDHWFDVPVEVAKSVAAFRYDEDPPGGGLDPFEVLVAAQGAGRKRWWPFGS